MLYIILGVDASRLSWHQERMVERFCINCYGRQVITLNVAITLRVTLAGIFKIPFHPPYTYCL